MRKSDIVASRPLPAAIRNDGRLHCACIGGATPITELREMLERTGFEKIVIDPLVESRELIRQWGPGKNAQDYVISTLIEAEKPRIDHLR
jgi:arsenite methyltransferase